VQQQVGPYRLVQRLGQGGMGAVYLAEHSETGGRYALKVLSGGLGPEDWLRFEREAQAMAAADGHPFVARVHQLGRDQGRPYLVMQLVEGGDLQGRLEKQGALAPLEAAALMAKAARGVAFLHERGVLHRDLKPHNVLLDAQGSPKLTDFGLARLAGAETLTQTGEVLGTPVYMAPEQARSEAPDARTDVYGLGAILYACLTGQPPVRGQSSVLMTLQAVLKEVPPLPSACAPGVPAWLDEVCAQALAKDPAERYSSASELAEALETRVAGKRRRGPWLTKAAGGVTALVLVALVLVALALSDLRHGVQPGSVRWEEALVTKARRLAREGAPADELLGAWRRAVVAAEASGDLEQLASARLELMHASYRRCDYQTLETQARLLFDDATHEAEARYLYQLSRSIRTGKPSSPELLREAERSEGPWGLLVQASQLAIEAREAGPKGADMRRRARQLLNRVEGGRAAHFALLTLAQIASDTGDHDPALLSSSLGSRADDASLRVFLAGLLCLTGKEDAARLERALELLEDARRLAEPRVPSGYHLRLYLCRRGLGKDAGALDALRAAVKHEEDTTKVHLELGFYLEALGQPLAAQRAWGQIPLSPPPDVDLSGLTIGTRLRVERAIGLPCESLSVPLANESRAELERWVGELPPTMREPGRDVLERAFRGATWRELEPLLKAIRAAHPGPEPYLLSGEVAIGRSFLDVGLGWFERAQELGAAPLRCALLGWSGGGPLPTELATRAGERALCEAILAVRQRQPVRALELLQGLPVEGVQPWVGRRALLVGAAAAMQTSDPSQREQILIRAVNALYMSHASPLVPFWHERLVAGARKREPTQDRLVQLARFLRLVPDAFSRLLALQGLALQPVVAQDRWAKSRALWTAEVEAELADLSEREGHWLRLELRIAEGLFLLARGAPAAEVEEPWRGIKLHGTPIGRLALKRFEHRYARPADTRPR